MQDAFVAWVNNLTPEQNKVFEELPLRRDMLTFLDYLSKNRTVGTQSTGNLPLKAVREICAMFVYPLKLEETITGHLQAMGRFFHRGIDPVRRGNQYHNRSAAGLPRTEADLSRSGAGG